MRNWWLSLLVVLAAGAASFGVFYALNDDAELRRAARDGDAMAWLRAEFHLSDEQFAAIRQLHDDYALVCTRHCRAIINARQRQAPAGEIATLEQICVDAMTEHFRRVAALMPTGEGERYLAIVLPRIANYEHVGAPSVQVTP